MNDAKIDSSMNYELVQVSESKSMKVFNKVNSWKKREVLKMGDPSQGSDLQPQHMSVESNVKIQQGEEITQNARRKFIRSSRVGSTEFTDTLP